MFRRKENIAVIKVMFFLVLAITFMVCTPAIASAATAQTLSTPTKYVTDLYEQILRRSPDSGGLAGWVAAINNGMSRDAVAAAFLSSHEGHAVIVNNSYNHFLFRNADPGGLAGWAGAMDSGLSERRLNAMLCSSSEFYIIYGRNSVGFIEGLYLSILGRYSDPGGSNSWVAYLAAGGTRYDAASAFLSSGEGYAAFVEQCYGSILYRHSDPGGLAGWVNSMARGKSENDVRAAFYACAEHDDINSIAAGAIMAQINALPTPANLVLTDTAQVAAARTAYESLTPTQKAFVTNLATLIAAENQMAALNAANAAIIAAESAPTQGNVNAANALMPAIVAGNAKTALQARIDAVQVTVNINAANAVTTLIDALPARANLVLTDAAQVTAARNAYTILTSAQKALVPNLATLVAAEAQISALTAATAAVETAEATPNQTNIDAATALMPAVYAGGAKTALQARIDAVQLLVDHTDAAAVDALIAALPTPTNLVLTDAPQVAGVRATYNALSSAKKALVTRLATLVAAETQISALTAATAAVVIAETTQNQTNIDAANALMPAVVAGSAKTALQNRINAVQTNVTTAANVITLINALPIPANLTLANTAQVAAARTAYDTLTLTQKGLVTNYSTLIAAEAQITALTAATAAVVTLETAAGADMLIEGNIVIAENALISANNAMVAVTAGAAKTALQNRINAASATITTVRTRFDSLERINAGTDSFADYANAGVTGAINGNLTAYREAIAAAKIALGRILVLGEVQAQVNMVNQFVAATAAVTTAEGNQTQANVNTAQALVSALPNGATKNNLQTRLNVVQANLDIIAAATVTGLISGLPIPANIVLGHTAQIAAAGSAYNSLTPAQKLLVLNLAVLRLAEDQISALTAATNAVVIAEGTKNQIDFDTAQTLVTAIPTNGAAKIALQARIDAIQIPVNVAAAAVRIAEETPLQANIDAAQLLVNGLPSGGMRNGLQARINAITSNANAAATTAVVAAETIPTQANVNSAQTLVTALPAGPVKTALQNRINAVQNTVSANIVIAMINALPTLPNLSLTNAGAVAAARSAFTALSLVQKELVLNLPNLIDAETQISSLTIETAAVTSLEVAALSDLTVEGNLINAEEALITANAARDSVVAGAAKTALQNRINAAEYVITTARNRFDALIKINAGTEVYADFALAGVSGAINDAPHKTAYDFAIEAARMALARDLTLAEVQLQIDLVNAP